MSLHIEVDENMKEIHTIDGTEGYGLHHLDFTFRETEQGLIQVHYYRRKRPEGGKDG